MIDYDQILIESSRVHRDRLNAAFVHGEQADRRPVNNNLRPKPCSWPTPRCSS